MLKIGLLGANKEGWQHAKAIRAIKGMQLAGVYDADLEIATRMAEAFDIPLFPSIDALTKASDAMDIVDVSVTFFPLASGLIKASKHLFIEPRLLREAPYGESLLNLSEEAKAKVQVGYTDRFNAVLLSAAPFIDDPVFIEVQQMVPYLPEFANTSVVEDLMIHDLDIILGMVKGNVKRVHATGINVFGKNPDIVNAHLEFDNGTTVNLTTNRIASESTRRFQFYKHYSRVELDFLKPGVKIFEKKNDQFVVKKLNVDTQHSLQNALTGFYHAIVKDTETPVPISSGCQVQQIASIITNKIEMISKAG